MPKYVNVKMEVVTEYEKEYRVRFIPEMGSSQQDHKVYKKHTSEYVEPPLDIVALPTGAVVRTGHHFVKYMKLADGNWVVLNGNRKGRVILPVEMAGFKFVLDESSEDVVN